MDQLTSLLLTLGSIGTVVFILSAYLIYKGKLETALEILIATLVILFIYTPVSKLMRVDDYISSMEAQPLHPTLSKILIYALPTVEFTAVILLAISRCRKMGLYLCFAMLLVFTGYISLIQFNYYGRIPCSCGGVITALDWKGHLFFNIYFIITSIAAIWINAKLDKKNTKKELSYSLGK